MNTDDAERQRAAAHPDTSPARLTELAEDPFLAPLVAANPGAPPSLLAALADRQVLMIRRAVASNPNTPFDVLTRLAPACSMEVLANPVLPLMALENPRILERFTSNALLRGLRLESLSETLVPLLTRHPDRDVALTGSMHIAVAGELAGDWRTAAAQAISRKPLLAQNLNRERAAAYVRVPGFVSPWFLRGLARHPSLLVRWVAAHAVALPADGVAALLEDDPEVPGMLEWPERTPLQNPWVRRGFGARRARIRHELRCLAAAHPNAPVDLLERLAGDRHAVPALALNPNVSPALLDRIVSDEADYEVRLNAARNSRADDSTLARLLVDRCPGVRSAAIDHHQLSPERQLELLLRTERGRRVVQARDPATPAETLRELATDREAQVRAAVAGNPAAPASVLEMLVFDGSFGEVRRALRENPSWRPDAVLLQRLATSRHVYDRMVAAGHPGLPPVMLTTLAEDRDRRVAVTALKNPAASPGLKERLNRFFARWVPPPQRERPDLSPLQLERAAGGWHPEIYLPVDAIWSRPVAGVSLEWLVDHGTDAARYYVARHPETPPALLEGLAQDSGRYTKYLARRRLELLRQGDPQLPQGDRGLERSMSLARSFVWTSTNQHLLRAFLLAWPGMPEAVLRLEASSPDWLDRLVIASNPATPADLLQPLSRDGNRLVRAAARETLARTGDRASSGGEPA